MVEDMHQLMNGSIQHLSKGGNKILVINYRQITSGDSQMHASQHDISVLSSSSLFLGKESMALSRLHHHGVPRTIDRTLWSSCHSTRSVEMSIPVQENYVENAA